MSQMKKLKKLCTQMHYFGEQKRAKSMERMFMLHMDELMQVDIFLVFVYKSYNNGLIISARDMTDKCSKETLSFRGRYANCGETSGKCKEKRDICKLSGK